MLHTPTQTEFTKISPRDLGKYLLQENLAVRSDNECNIPKEVEKTVNTDPYWSKR